MGDGAATEAGPTPDAQAGAEGGLPHAATPDAVSPSEGAVCTSHVPSPVICGSSHTKANNTQCFFL